MTAAWDCLVPYSCILEDPLSSGWGCTALVHCPSQLYSGNQWNKISKSLWANLRYKVYDVTDGIYICLMWNMQTI